MIKHTNGPEVLIYRNEVVLVMCAQIPCETYLLLSVASFCYFAALHIIAKADLEDEGY